MGLYPTGVTADDDDDGTTPPVTTDYIFAPIPEDVLYDLALSAQAVRIYGVLMRYGLTPGSCFPSHKTIGERVGSSERSVQRPLRELVKAGWITKVRRFNKRGERTSDGYHVHTRRAEMREPTARKRPVVQRAETSEERKPLEPSNESSSLVASDENAGLIVKGYIDWCDRNQRPRPARPGQVGKTVAQLLAANYSAAAIKRALTTTSVFTVTAMEYELRKQTNGHGMSPAQAKEARTAQAINNVLGGTQ